MPRSATLNRINRIESIIQCLCVYTVECCRREEKKTKCYARTYCRWCTMCLALYVHTMRYYMARKYLELWWKNRFGRALVAVIFVPLFSSFLHVVVGLFRSSVAFVVVECMYLYHSWMFDTSDFLFLFFLTSHLNTLARHRNTIEPKLMIIYTWSTGRGLGNMQWNESRMRWTNIFRNKWSRKTISAVQVCVACVSVCEWVYGN